LVIFLWRKSGWTGKLTFRHTLWVSGPPSSHMALLASSVYLIAYYTGFGPLFGFSIMASGIVAVDLVKNKTHAQLFDARVTKKSRPDFRAEDFNGHTVFDVISGVCVGLVLTWIMLAVFGT
jgi:acid phosphatase family membrane protein YuiD